MWWDQSQSLLLQGHRKINNRWQISQCHSITDSTVCTLQYCVRLVPLNIESNGMVLWYGIAHWWRYMKFRSILRGIILRHSKHKQVYSILKYPSLSSASERHRHLNWFHSSLCLNHFAHPFTQLQQQIHWIHIKLTNPSLAFYLSSFVWCVIPSLDWSEMREECNSFPNLSSQ